MKKAIAEKNVDLLQEINIELIHDQVDKKLIKCIQKYKEVCAKKILMTYGRDLLSYYLDICSSYDRNREAIETEEYLAKYHSKEDLYEIDPKQERADEIKRILIKRGHGDLWDMKEITVEEFKQKYG